ncbi:MAG: ribosome silencing factor [Spirochaetae bacterium HGW-Spirochaetae-3]|nr:MAG: ribosome silencing factor [Spirochaetae bacterium HGW-Spirochaetae-3]
MGGTVSIDVREAAFGCAGMLAEHNGGDTIVLDLTKLSTWTDFFVVTSATSSTHLRGLARQVEDYLATQGYSPLRRPRLAEDEQWCLLDFGDFVVHIMAAEAREFYELDKLWFEAELTRIPAPEAPAKA